MAPALHASMAGSPRRGPPSTGHAVLARGAQGGGTAGSPTSARSKLGFRCAQGTRLASAGGPGRAHLASQGRAERRPPPRQGGHWRTQARRASRPQPAGPSKRRRHVKVYVNVCRCVCVCVCARARVCVFIRAASGVLVIPFLQITIYIYVYIYMHIYLCRCSNATICTHMYFDVCLHWFRYVYIYIYLSLSLSIYIYHVWISYFKKQQERER